MIEDTNTEPPPPPDIRPFGRTKWNKHNNNNQDALNDEPGRPHLPCESEVEAEEGKCTSYTEDGTGQPRSKWLFRIRGGAANMTITILLLGIILTASTASASPTSSLGMGKDEYTSYASSYQRDAMIRSSKRRTPILSFLKYILDYASSSLSHFTDSDTMHVHMMGKRELSTGEIVEACMIPVLVALSGMFAGLTLGYFSVDPTQLQVLSISGTPKQQKYAMKILPVRKDSHLLLTTLILGNMIVNEALPVVMDNVIGGGIYAVIASTALVVIFAEIIPQSICSRYGLLVGASMAWPVKIMIWIAFPIAWPIAKLLEYILGAHHGIIYRRSELRELIKMHAATAEGGGDLDFDTVQMAQGALDLAQKTVREAMTPIEQVFMLPIEAKLDYETLGHVVRSGHSRIPVYQMVEVPDINLATATKGPAKTKMVKKVLGSLLVKSCVLLDPEDATPLASIPINAIPSVPYDEPLTNMLNVFQEGRSHMAIVSRRPKRVEKDLEDAESVMTAAAGGLRQRFMRKVAEISHGNKSSSDSDSSETDTDVDVERGEKGENKKRRKKTRIRRINSGSDGTAVASSPTSTTAAEEVKLQQEQERKKKASLVEKAKLTQLEQTVPADAQMAPGAVEKFFEGLEGAPLGVITLEDVLEELIGEEIYDEYDEHGVPRSDASAFVPREAMLAARKAALARQNLTLAESTPLPATNDADLEQPQSQSTGARRVIPKLITKPKFGLGKKPASQPGRSRTADVTITSSTPPPPAAPAQSPGNDAPSISLAAGGEIKRTSSPGEIDQDDAPRRTQSEVKMNARRQSTPTDPQVASTGAGVVPLKGIDPVTAVPARLLSSGGAVTPNIAPPSGTNNLLNEALMIERGRRKAGANTPPIIRAVSQGATLGIRSNVPSRQPTPPSQGSTSTASGPSGPSVPTGGIVSPQPVQAKKVPKFKSVPAPPLVSTPTPSERGGSIDGTGGKKSEGKE
ncbi:hypothetical protein I204_02063 [Kwoniella mangroviensis CBS 8886]|uniref:uncharacterized protein n=1 Tax=Kwoniella mangroviensis CBS 8507 TaxID=1296122 RepID=UPI00080D19DA|nr:uncharacterized protein I203_03630 [Kwoniella mangroviensis CBS 8507]OCF66948.1 hypothetical protein I203_03630 [Kwoniella mangroviensis CBS 8507]OCF78057.1 hypothetical protein I204_02063 [Kwoniella mangroviensis CBS 8886]